MMWQKVVCMAVIGSLLLSIAVGVAIQDLRISMPKGVYPGFARRCVETLLVAVVMILQTVMLPVIVAHEVINTIRDPDPNPNLTKFKWWEFFHAFWLYPVSMLFLPVVVWHCIFSPVIEIYSKDGNKDDRR